MWVRLTTRGMQTLERLDPPAIEHLTRIPPSSRRDRWDVDAPYTCWRHFQRLLINEAFGPNGGKRREVRGSTVKALQAITKALNFIDTHPALSCRGVIGWQGTRIPAWRLNGRYVPYPVIGHEFVILKPVWETSRNGTRVTRWEESEGSPAEEHVHLLFG